MYYVYILSNKNNNVIYIGVTNNLVKRVYEHKNKFVKGFTSRYNVNKLVYYEIIDDIVVAIEREKVLKGWLRERKIALINTLNPKWNDLYVDICKWEILRYTQDDKGRTLGLFSIFNAVSHAERSEGSHVNI